MLPNWGKSLQKITNQSELQFVLWQNTRRVLPQLVFNELSVSLLLVQTAVAQALLTNV